MRYAVSSACDLGHCSVKAGETPLHAETTISPACGGHRHTRHPLTPMVVHGIIG
jgi:hypothetical protein